MADMLVIVETLGGWVNTILVAVAIIVIIFGGKWLWNKIRPQVKALPPFNSSLKKENAATVIFRNFYKIKKFNDTPVNWSVSLSKAASILVPPGQLVITFSYDEEGVGSGSDLKAFGNTEAGKTYLMRSKIVTSEFLKKEMSTVLVECKGDDLLNYLKKSSNEML